MAFGQGEIELILTSDTVKVQLSFYYNGSYRAVNKPFKNAAHNLIKAVAIGDNVELKYYQQELLDGTLELIDSMEISIPKWNQFATALVETENFSKTQDPQAWDIPTPSDYIIISSSTKKLSFDSYGEHGRDAFRMLLGL